MRKKEALALLERDMIRLNRAALHRKATLAMVSGFLDATTKPLSRIGSRDVEKHLSVLADEGQSPDARHRVLVSLRTFFRVLVTHDVLATSPVEKIAMRRPEPGVPLLLSEDAVAKLLAGASVEPENRAHRTPVLSKALALRDRACLELLYSLGLRLSEAARVQVTDLRLSERTLLVRRSKNGRGGLLPLPEASVSHLERYLVDGRPVLVRPERDPGNVLLTRLGTPLAQPVVMRLVNHAAARAGLLKAHPHALRRALATHLVRAGASVVAVQDYLGHTSIESTACYLGVERDDLRKAVEILEHE